jgi:hypothetical protein
MFRTRSWIVILVFIVIGFAADVLAFAPPFGNAARFIAAPAMVIVQHLRLQFPMVPGSGASPQHDLALLIPITLGYFGFNGFWFCQILKEEGFLKLVILTSYLAFLAAVHWQAYSFVSHVMLRG